MNLKEILTFIKLTLENNVISAVKALKSHIYTVKLESSKVEVTNPTKLPKVFPVKEINPKNYDKQLRELSNSVKTNIAKLSSELLKQLSSLEKVLKPYYEVKINNLKEIAPFGKVQVTNPQKSVSITNLFELQKEIGKLKKAVESLKLDPKIVLPEFPVPQVNVPVQKTPIVNVDLSKLEEILGILSNDPKNPIAVRLSDGTSFYEALKEINTTLSAGGGKYAYKNSEGEGLSGLVDENRHVMISGEDRWGLNNTEKVGNTTYMGQEDSQGNWLITKIVKSGSSVAMSYATHLNNDTINVYIYAWSHKVDLEFDRYSLAF